MDDLAVAGARAGPEGRRRLEHQDVPAALREPPRDGQPDDARADHHAIRLLDGGEASGELGGGLQGSADADGRARQHLSPPRIALPVVAPATKLDGRTELGRLSDGGQK